MFEWRPVADRGVDPAGVEPRDVLDDRKLEPGVGAPDAIVLGISSSNPERWMFDEIAIDRFS